MHSYIGITIGPIFNTILDASSPAALWFASSLFSDASRRVCAEIKKVFSDAVIYSPYYSDAVPIDDGIGRFHDRIIFSTEHYDREKVQKCILKVKRETTACFPGKLVNADVVKFMEQYIQMPFVKLEEKELQGQNCVLVMSPYLDALELMRSFPTDSTGNVIRKLFCGEEEGGNIYIKESPLFKRITADYNQLKKNKDGLWTIEDIACHHGKVIEKLKRKDYYAIVQADGDNMSSFLNTLDHQAVTVFSEACFDYDEAACKEIGKFGGMTIYVGGDDLLFLAPIINEEGKNVFQLCNEIGNIFFNKMTDKEALKNSSCIPTVSFGIALQHKKFPLYEALARARVLLDLAKKATPQKNNMAVEVLKHSGNSIKVVVPNNEFEVLQKVLVIRTKEEKTIHSVIYTLQKFQQLIFVLDAKMREQKIDGQAYEYAFMNLFDNVEQAQMEKYLREVCHIYWQYFAVGDTQIHVPEQTAEPSRLKAYIHLLLIQKFLVEKEGEKD